MHTLKLTQVGNSVGAIFPKELLARLQLEKGDELYVTESPDGLRITTHNPEFEAQMRVAREIMKETIRSLLSSSLSEQVFFPREILFDSTVSRGRRREWRRV